jgi:uncharacterized cupin superfamily protein
MKYVRLYTGADGKSHFEDVEVEMKEDTNNRRRAEPMKVSSAFFRETGANYDFDWHNAAHRQFVITLEGEVEIEASDGTTRRFGPGDVMLAEDTYGAGHISRALHNKPRMGLWVLLD